MEKRNEVSYEITEHVGVIRAYNSGWQKECNVIRWNDGPKKYDIRDWDLTHEHMTRGITLYPDEMDKLCELMAQR